MRKLREFLFKDNTFIILMVLICAGVMASTNLYVTDHVGGMGNVSLTQMVDAAMKTNDWSALIGFSGGFLIARILEGPLVGILDIGGSIMAGVGFGVFGLVASTQFGLPILSNFPFALLVGAVTGLVLGAVIMGIRKFIPEGVTASGTDIMMGVGHQMGIWLPPLVLLAALQYSIPVGIGATVGGLIFQRLGKGVMGGILLGLFIIAFFV